ncbi:dUTPase-like protein [Lipomyces kononenkoae]
MPAVTRAVRAHIGKLIPPSTRVTFRSLHLCIRSSPSSSSPPSVQLISRRFFRSKSITMSPATISSSQATSVPAAVPTAPVLQVKLLSDKAKVPTRGSALAAGYDIYGVEDYLIKAQDRGIIETDIAVAIPAGYYGRIAPRSGLATKHGLQTGAGVVDADYRGPLKILLFNHSNEDFQVHAGDRIAQMVIEKIITPEVVAVPELDNTERGSNGFGSTGGFGVRPAKGAEDAAMKEQPEAKEAVFVEQTSEPVVTSPASENGPENIQVPATTTETAPEKAE